MNPGGFQRTPKTADGRRALDATWITMDAMIRRIAARITPAKDDQEDLFQVALVAFWEGEPARYDLSKPREMRWVRRKLVRTMWREWGSAQHGDRKKADQIMDPERRSEAA